MTDEGDGGSPRPGRLRDDVESWRDELVKLLIVGLPTLLVQQLYGAIAQRFFDQPWHALWFVVPLAGAAWIAWRVVVRRQRELVLRGPLLVFFGVYAAAFAVAAQSDLLDWRRDLIGRGEEAPRSWLLPSRFGDWRYWLAPRASGPDDLLLVTTRPANNPEAGRQQILKLIVIADRHRVRGIAFDYHLEQTGTQLDASICERIRSAEIPVLFGYLMERKETGAWGPRPLLPALRTCLEDARRGHLMVFRDPDERVRLVPLVFGRTERPALSLRVAAELQGTPVAEMETPDDGYLQPLPPAHDHLDLAFEEMEGRGEAELRSVLEGMFLLVGDESEAERFATPTGERLGVEIHADAIQALRNGAYLRRVRPELSYGVILLLCYLVTALAAAGSSTGRLVKLALAASAALVGASALAAWAARLWVDVAYALVAVWLLLALLVPLRRWPGLEPSAGGAPTGRLSGA